MEPPSPNLLEKYIPLPIKLNRNNNGLSLEPICLPPVSKSNIPKLAIPVENKPNPSPKPLNSLEDIPLLFDLLPPFLS